MAKKTIDFEATGQVDSRNVFDATDQDKGSDSPKAIGRPKKFTKKIRVFTDLESDDVQELDRIVAERLLGTKDSFKIISRSTVIRELILEGIKKFKG